MHVPTSFAVADPAKPAAVIRDHSFAPVVATEDIAGVVDALGRSHDQTERAIAALIIRRNS